MNEEERFKAEIAAFNAARDALFRNPTLEAATAHMPEPSEGWDRPDVPLASVHKARLQWLDATDAMLAESKAWLEAHGYDASWQGAEPLTPERRDADRAQIGKPPLGSARRTDYPEEHKPGHVWSVDAAWEILDSIKPGVIPDDVRFWLAGTIAGRLERTELEALVRERRRVHESAIAGRDEDGHAKG